MRYANGMTVKFESTEVPMGGAVFIDAEANTYLSHPRRKGFELPTV